MVGTKIYYYTLLERPLRSQSLGLPPRPADICRRDSMRADWWTCGDTRGHRAKPKYRVMQKDEMKDVRPGQDTDRENEDGEERDGAQDEVKEDKYEQ